MGRPAARLTDMHICPMWSGLVPHVGGPIIAPCDPNVLIGGLPAARVTDLAICCGPTDVIVQGSPTVLIGGLMAARLGDMTAHGGVIVVGDPTVLIGDGAGGEEDDSDDGDDNIDDDSDAEQDDDADADADADADHANPDAGSSESNKLALEGSTGTDGTSIDLTKTWLDKSVAARTMGGPDDHLSLLSANAEAESGISFDPSKQEFTATLIDASASVSLLDAQAKQSAASGMLQSSETLVVGQLGGNLDVSAGYSGGTFQAKAEGGVDAMLVQGSAQGSIRITGTTIYDNTIGRLLHTSAPESWDKGIVLGAQGQAGIGASASADGSAEIGSDGIELHAGVKAGAVLVGGLNLNLGIIW